MRKLILFSFGGYVLGAALVLVAAFFVLPRTATWEEWAKVVGVGLTLITALSGAVISLYSAEKQRNTTVELENTKQAFTQEIKILETTFARELEYVKNRLTAETKAYDELYGAASILFYTLAKLEVGQLNASEAADADKKMIKASRYLAVIDNTKVDVWRRLWHNGRRIIETVNQQTQDDTGTVTSVAKDPKAQKALWAKEAKEFGELLEQFRAVAYPSPLPEPTKPT